MNPAAWRRFRTRMVDAVTARASGAKLAQVPAGGAILWSLFGDLSGSRGNTGFGQLPIAMTEIEAVIRLRGLPLQDHHIDVLIAMDRAWMAVANKKSEPIPDGAKVLPRRSEHPITPELFDLAI